MLNIAVVPLVLDAQLVLQWRLFWELSLYVRFASIAQGQALRSIGKGGSVEPPGFPMNIPSSKRSIPSSVFYTTLTAKKTAVAVFS